MHVLQHRTRRSFRVLIATLILGMVLGTLAVFAEKGNAQGDIPTLDQLKQLTQTTIHDFALAVNDRDFRAFYQNIAKLWQEQTTAPEGITITEFNIDTSQIANALTASGYQAETLETEGTLYSILDDYQFSLKFPTRTGRLGNLNRIALLDGQMVIAKATALVSNSLLAYHGEQPSLADNPDYVAAAKALEDPVLNDTGELVGAILMTAPNFFDPASLLGSSANEGALRLLKDYAQKPLLPPYSLVAFATRHAEGASFLILTVVFPQGTDTNAAADILADRLQHYVSVAQGTPLDDRWTFEKATAVEAEGLPVVLTVMRVDDPPPPQDAPQVNANVLTWSSLIFKRDALFLIPGEIPELPEK